MANTSMNVSLPEALKEYVEERVAGGSFSNPSDFVRALIREDMRRHAGQRLERLLLEGVSSGAAEPMTDEDWLGIRAEAERRAKAASRDP